MEWNTPENIEILEQGEIFDRTYKDGQLRPADTEAMVGQGPIVIHAKENPATSDKGVVLFRRRIQREIRALKEGKPPLQATSFGPAPIPTWSGDTVLKVPCTEVDDDKLRADTFAEVVNVYRSAGKLRGEERDAFIMEALKKLESAA